MAEDTNTPQAQENAKSWPHVEASIVGVKEGIHMSLNTVIAVDGVLDRNQLFRLARSIGDGHLQDANLFLDGNRVCALKRAEKVWKVTFVDENLQPLEVERSATTRPDRKTKDGRVIKNAAIDPGPDFLKAVTAVFNDRLTGVVEKSRGGGGGGKKTAELKAERDTALAQADVLYKALLAAGMTEDQVKQLIQSAAPSTAPEDAIASSRAARDAARSKPRK